MQTDDSLNVEVYLRSIGSNDDFILCLIFDENSHVLLTLWALNEHVEMLPMRYGLIYHDVSALNLLDFTSNNNEILYLASVDGILRIFDLLKIKPNTKVQNLLIDDAIKQENILPNEELDHLVCLANDLIAISSTTYINIFHRKNLSKTLQKISLNQTLFDWNMISQDDHHRILITIDSGQQFITIYRQEKDFSSTLKEEKIQFRSDVEFVKLIQTTTIMDNDEKKKTYVLILLDDQTIQLLDANQLSQASLQPNSLFTRIKNYHVRFLSPSFVF